MELCVDINELQLHSVSLPAGSSGVLHLLSFQRGEVLFQSFQKATGSLG